MSKDPVSAPQPVGDPALLPKRDDAQDADGPVDTDAHSATLLAIRNALKLGTSLLVTGGIAYAMNFLVPKHLGPDRFGTLNFADVFTIAFFNFLTLGADAYIRKEVAVRPSHASDFFGGMFVLRIAMSVVIFGAMAVVLNVTHRPAEVQQVVFLYGATRFFVNANETLSAILHAKGRVGAMSVLAIATKIVWAGGVLGAVATHAGLWAYAVAYFASEAIESVVLYRLAQTHIGLEFRVDVQATKAMLLACVPYYLNTIAIVVYGNLGGSLLEFLGSSKEVGFYGAASKVANLTQAINPLIGWVIMPMFARAVVRSKDEFHQQIRRSLELILTVAIPASLMINLGADFWIHLLVGDAFLPAVFALRVLATIFVVTYIAIIFAIVLIMMNRPWALTITSLMGMGVNVALNSTVIRPALRFFGEGGGGAGASLATLGTEIFVTLCMMSVVGRAAFDRRSVSAVVKSLAAYGVVALAHRAMAPLGPVRLAVDGALYLVIVIATGALRVREMITVARDALRNRKASQP